eukprot:6318853-Pyramimonas_sp.AAC.1
MANGARQAMKAAAGASGKSCKQRRKPRISERTLDLLAAGGAARKTNHLEERNPDGKIQRAVQQDKTRQRRAMARRSCTSRRDSQTPPSNQRPGWGPGGKQPAQRSTCILFREYTVEDNEPELSSKQ